MRCRFLILALFVFIFPTASYAQSLQSLSGGTAGVSLSISPEYPAPYGEATLSVTSSTLDLAAATMVVRVNGKGVYSGNVKKVLLPLAGAGVVQDIEVDITSRGETVSKTTSIQPQDVALVAEPLSSAPPLYEGKSLVPLNGSVRLVAVANLRTNAGTRISPGEASYRWFINGAYRANSSGIGKTSLLLSSPLKYRSSDVSVIVSSPVGALVGGNSITLFAQEPSLRVYEQDALLGVRFNKALPRSYPITKAEATLYAGAFSFPTQSPLSFEWFVDGAGVHTGKSVTLRPSGGGEGSASLSLVASTEESARTSLLMSLSFETKVTNFFGL